MAEQIANNPKLEAKGKTEKVVGKAQEGPG
jgi:uncharacterized protein YjbJ (UPF0337 family)